MFAGVFFKMLIAKTYLGLSNLSEEEFLPKALTTLAINFLYKQLSKDI